MNLCDDNDTCSSFVVQTLPTTQSHISFSYGHFPWLVSVLSSTCYVHNSMPRSVHHADYLLHSAFAIILRILHHLSQHPISSSFVSQSIFHHSIEQIQFPNSISGIGACDNDIRRPRRISYRSSKTFIKLGGLRIIVYPRQIFHAHDVSMPLCSFQLPSFAFTVYKHTLYHRHSAPSVVIEYNDFKFLALQPPISR